MKKWSNESTPKSQKIKNATPYGSQCEKTPKHENPQNKEY